jgi:rhamnogalacturonyl hydrolase YesR
MAASFVSKRPKIDRHYVSAVLHEGIQKAGSLHTNSILLNYTTSAISSLVSANGTLIGWNPTYYSLDDLRIGNNILSLYETGNQQEKQKYKKAATALRRQLDTYPRTASGGFWHRSPVYKDQMWLDGLYMAQTFYATYTSLFDPGNETAWADIARQFDLIEQHTRNATSGLLAHGYDESGRAVWADRETGASPHVWCRAVGWYFMALVEVLQVFPKSLDGYERLKTYLTTLAGALVKAQDGESGGWWLIMDEPYPGMKGNYIESSATAMFVYGFLKGMRTGLLEEGYREPARRAYELCVGRFLSHHANGTLSWEGTVEVGSLSGDASYEYYISVPLSQNDGKGAGPFMFASTEMEMWRGLM